jgi:hypothetical protein
MKIRGPKRLPDTAPLSKMITIVRKVKMTISDLEPARI